MKILDVGIGQIPWIFRDPEKEERIQMGIPPDITGDMTYIGVDTDIDQLTECRERWREKIQSSRGRFLLLRSDATHLPFTDSEFDTVILSDVFSHPSDNWCDCDDDCYCRCVKCECRGKEPTPPGPSSSCCGMIFAGIQAESKKKMIQEALRVVRAKGKLVIANYQTQEIAVPYMDELERLALDGTLACVEKGYGHYFVCLSPIAYIAEVVYQVSLSNPIDKRAYASAT